MKIIIWLMLFGNAFTAQALMKVQQISPDVYALVGELSQRSQANLGNNSTHGVIVTDEGVILIDSGASYLGAKQIHQIIQKITDKPIKIVINTGGQDHRWLGNGYFKKLGAIIISSAEARKDQKIRVNSQISRLDRLIGDSLEGTTPVFADTVFKNSYNIELGNTKLALYYQGGAHTLGDIFVYMPSEKIMFSGDIVFNDRMLGIGPAKNFQSWMQVFEKMAKFDIKTLIPGHGRASTLETATHDTYEYLLFLKKEVAKILNRDGSLLEISNIDQSRFHYLKNYESISGKNAGWVFEQMEFDY
ncbi:MBL-fold metallo-hydrolase superfamily [uncultured Gammaproteobacteria bacterium]|nr:MBL-fold metallo-hydrolase superfamily [uncultured Gammaproteobacteria bacterium]